MRIRYSGVVSGGQTLCCVGSDKSDSGVRFFNGVAGVCRSLREWRISRQSAFVSDKPVVVYAHTVFWDRHHSCHVIWRMGSMAVFGGKALFVWIA